MIARDETKNACLARLLDWLRQVELALVGTRDTTLHARLLTLRQIAQSLRGPWCRLDEAALTTLSAELWRITCDVDALQATLAAKGDALTRLIELDDALRQDAAPRAWSGFLEALRSALTGGHLTERACLELTEGAAIDWLGQALEANWASPALAELVLDWAIATDLAVSASLFATTGSSSPMSPCATPAMPAMPATFGGAS